MRVMSKLLLTLFFLSVAFPADYLHLNIVTANYSSSRYSDFPAYSQILLKLAFQVNLRTVIVTAAVYWGFGSKLLQACAQMTSPLNLPAPGRCQSIYSAFTA
jgi:hypothetical protein